MYQFRDFGIKQIKARPDQYLSGMGLGVLLLDDHYPAFPGDVRNPSAYPFPIQYEIVEGVDIYRLVRGENKASCLEPILKAARKLEKLGCR
ncbi:MAG: aspartate/glutamate racemase family protein, partial [Anaerolineales bacterium]